MFVVISMSIHLLYDLHCLKQFFPYEEKSVWGLPFEGCCSKGLADVDILVGSSSLWIYTSFSI